MREIWDSVLTGAEYIFSETIGGLLGWVSALVVLVVPLLVICFLLKKAGYGHLIHIRFRKAPPGLGWDSVDQRQVEPEAPKQAERPGHDVPQWQQELMETWEKEARSSRGR